MNTIYEAEAILSSPGHGLASLHTNDGSLKLQVTNPQKSQRLDHATNPEQLFAAAFVSCFENSLLFRARELGMHVNRTEIKGRVSLTNLDDGKFKLLVALEVDVPGLSPEETQKLIDESSKIWPFADTQVGGIEVRISPAGPSSAIM